MERYYYLRIFYILGIHAQVIVDYLIKKKNYSGLVKTLSFLSKG